MKNVRGLSDKQAYEKIYGNLVQHVPHYVFYPKRAWFHTAMIFDGKVGTIPRVFVNGQEQLPLTIQFLMKINQSKEGVIVSYTYNRRKKNRKNAKKKKNQPPQSDKK